MLNWLLGPDVKDMSPLAKFGMTFFLLLPFIFVVWGGLAFLGIIDVSLSAHIFAIQAFLGVVLFILSLFTVTLALAWDKQFPDNKAK